MTILMVCLGNICRSPLAQGILANKLNSEMFMVDSAGTSNYHIGKLPDERSIAIAQKMGLDITNQRARQITAEDFNHFDLIYVMDKSNYINVVALTSDEKKKQKVKLILSEINGEDMEVPDPYHGDEDSFKHVFDLLDIACENIAQKLQKSHE